MKNKVLVALLFLAGCVVGGVSSQIIIPPARAGATPVRWEHFCFNEGMKDQTVTNVLNQAGAMGWELATVNTGGNGGWSLYCMKRQMP